MAAMPMPYTPLTGSNAAVGPAPEQTSLQEEANQLLSQIESAHTIVGQISGGDQPPAGQSSVTLGAALHTCRERMGMLLDRLSDLSRYTGAV